MRVHATDSLFSAAIDELPLAATREGRPDAAEIVIGVVALSAPTAVRVLDHESALSAPDPRTVVVHRPRLRSDVAAEIAGRRTPYARIEVEVSASRHQIAPAIADAAGWVRVLSGEAVVPGRSAAVGRRAIAEARAGKVVITWQVRVREEAVAVIRIRAIGPHRIGVDVRGAPARTRVVAHDDAGATTFSTAWESAERSALRRAVDAVWTREHLFDVDDLLADSRLSDWILASINDGDAEDRQPPIP